MFVSPFATPTQLSFQIISFCYIVHAMKIYLNRKQNSARVISVFLLQSFRIEYKLLCKKKITYFFTYFRWYFSFTYFYIVNSPTFHLLFVNSPTFICSMFYTFSTTIFTFLKTLILPHLRGDDQNCPRSLSHLRGDDQNCPRTLILPLLLGPCLGFFWNIAALICQT